MSSYSYYPSSSGSVEHIRRPAAEDGQGSFGPVLVVLAVVSFLSVAACIAGRVCGRGSSSSTADEQQGSEAEKAGFGATQLVVMRPVPCSRATVHDLDEAFEIKLLPPNPAGARETGGPGTQQQPVPPPPRQFMAAAGAPGFRGPPSGNGGVVRPPHVRSGAAFVPAQAQRCK
ncbi:hypothetical protein PR202_ga16929 [Eleusine coracana subsp. coracana]|uniref:Uncharacterized protein n=1 Tax=Eleusine coracana subsp. coracana TaxID=191504 RepID=A0AAV5CNV5_ELECO|nr:hypothetical protein QOZ80_6AG0520450 [Eleusine coracana subsp. coracana]GJM99794.1 hypothetical protein PR202_ga16929 [Eleusine coracana subsp. coracana]